MLELPASAVYEGVPFEDLIMFPALRGEYGPGDPAELVKGAPKRWPLQFKAHRFERTRPNGRTHLVEGTPMVRDGKTGFVASYTDISDRKQAEGVLQAKRRAADPGR